MALNRPGPKTLTSRALLGVAFIAAVGIGVPTWVFRSWVMSNLGLLNLILAVAGFGILLRQVHKARSAAEAAEQATERVREAIIDRETLLDVTAIRGMFHRTQEALRGSRYETALLHVQALRESLYQLRSRRGFQENSERRADIQAIVVTLARYQKNLERRIADDTTAVKVAAMNTALAQFAGTFAEWGEQHRFMLGRMKS